MLPQKIDAIIRINDITGISGFHARKIAFGLGLGGSGQIMRQIS